LHFQIYSIGKKNRKEGREELSETFKDRALPHQRKEEGEYSGSADI